MYTYFKDCQTIEEAKSLYKKLARENHPDVGGDTATMQAINAEWAHYQAEYAKTDARKRQQEAHAAGKKSAADYHDLDSLAEELRAVIETLLNISPEIVVELCGLWVWVTGNTKPYKDQIKAAGLKWAHEKQAWYYAAVPSFNRQKRTMDEIRNMHGSQQFSRRPQEEEAPRQPLPAGV